MAAAGMLRFIIEGRKYSLAKTLQGLCAHAKAQVGQLYWYGTFGQRPTLDLLLQKRRQYPKYMTAERYDYAKKYHVGKEKRVYDCAGLVKSYWMTTQPADMPKYNVAYDKSAAGMKAACKTKGKLSDMPDTPGLLVFQGMSHVGVYVGSGKVTEARGFSYGVVETALNDRPWDSWGKLDWLEEEQSEKKEEACTCNCKMM
jgi:cell wall-associated NlpC family hydrolase